MVLELIFGLAILAIIFYIAMRLLHSIVFGVVLIVLVFVASYLAIGAFPDLKAVPIIGPFLNLPSTLGEALETVRGFFVNIDIISTARDSENNLLITVTNNGVFELTDYKVYVGNTTAAIKNKPKEPLRYKETTTIETDWKGNFTYVAVETKQDKSTYKQ